MDSRLWKIFNILFAVAALLFTGKSLHKLYLYNLFNTQTYASSTNWSIKEISKDEQYALQANYSFVIGGTTYSGEDIIYVPPYRNAWAAEQGIKENTSKRLAVWYYSQDPKYSSLQKYFPIKECLSTLVIWGLLFYFIGLRTYTAKLK